MQAEEQTLIDELATFGIRCSSKQAQLLLQHLALVIEKNKIINLTRITSQEEARILHVVDSLLTLSCELVDLGEDSHFIDMGTGAGFPGVPLGIMTGAYGVLIDSVGKKTTAVNEFCQKLSLANLSACHSRLEEIPPELLSSQDYVFARAVAQSNTLLELATPYLKHGGLVVLQKANPSEEEVLSAERAAKVCGLKNVSRETFELPHGLGHREVVIYKKVAKADVKLPRKNGEAKRNPLG